MSGGSWREMFEPGRPGVEQPPGGSPPMPPSALEPADEPLGRDRNEYRPWIVQRVRSRPAPMLDLRRYEPRSGLWCGWQLSYASLAAIEYVGDRLLTLDFGGRQFAVEGVGLDVLSHKLQQGLVLAAQEYAPGFWPVRPAGAIVTAIRRLGPPDAGAA